MTQVYLGLGSNIEQAKNLLSGLDALSQWSELSFSPVYESPAFGFDGPVFWNMVVGLELDLPVVELLKALRTLEMQHGRQANATKFSSRRLDIDLLLYGDLDLRAQGIDLPRAEITERAYVLKPLKDLSPALIMPAAQSPVSELWSAYQQQHPVEANALRSVELCWRGRQFSRAA